MQSSRDKVRNKEGKELLEWLENEGLSIVNGRKEKDGEGSFTYIGCRGCTVINYIITNEEGWEKIDTCKIEERVESDHLPVTIGWRTEEEEETNEEKYMWDEESIKRYRAKLEEELEDKEDRIGWSELKEIIKKSMVTKRIKIKGKVRRKEEW